LGVSPRVEDGEEEKLRLRTRKAEEVEGSGSFARFPLVGGFFFLSVPLVGWAASGRGGRIC